MILKLLDQFYYVRPVLLTLHLYDDHVLSKHRNIIPRFYSFISRVEVFGRCLGRTAVQLLLQRARK